MSEHWYDPKTGEPRHFVPKKDGTGNRPSTIRDARAGGWVPSVTTVLRALDKPALTTWLIRNAVTAALTTPRLPNETVDAFMERILAHDAEDESAKARDLGTNLHAAAECLLDHREAMVAPDLLPWIKPACDYLLHSGEVRDVEIVLVGEGYAGKVDLILETPEAVEVIDLKSSKTLPKKGAYAEHRLQTAAYAAALARQARFNREIRTANLYVSTVDCGQYVWCPHDEPWQETFEKGFKPCLAVWCWMNSYRPALEKVEL